MKSQREPIATTPPLVEEKLVAKPRPQIRTGAKCTQCGEVIPHMSMFLKNVTCRECYGLERYKRGETSMIGTGRKIPAPTTEPVKPTP